MLPALFVSLSGPDAGVSESQVMDYGKFVTSLGLQFRYLFFEGMWTGLLSGRQLKRRVAALSRHYSTDIQLRYLPGPLTDAGLQLAGYTLARVAELLPSGRVLIQARGAAAACAALAARRRLEAIAVLYDARGDEAAEARLEISTATTRTRRSRWERRAKRLDFLQQRAAAGADHVLAVSNPLRDRLCMLGEIPPARVSVVPCCVDAVRFCRQVFPRQSIRRRLNLDDRVVFVYSGSLGLWQIPDRIAALMEALRACLPAAHLLLLTRDRDAAARFFGRLIEQGTATIEDCPFEAVGDYLAAADVALLLRQDDPVNRVACPVKFAEYQVAGLPVIATPGIGDVSDYLARTGHGLLIRLDESPQDQASRVIAALKDSRWPDREAIRRQGLKIFSRESYRNVYRGVLSALGIPLSGMQHNQVSSALFSAR